MKSWRQPTLLFSTLTVVLATVLFGYTRLVLSSSVVPLTLVLPLLLCVWSRQRWQLWGMAAAFMVVTTIRAFWILPNRPYAHPDSWLYFLNNAVNLLLSALAVQAIMAYRDRLEQHSAVISARNEEIESQTEQLAQQNEEIEAQSVELEAQNEDLRQSNERLKSREEILEMLLQSSRALELGADVLSEVCRRALGTLGKPADAIALLELEGDKLVLRAQAAANGSPPLPPEWPLASSIGRVVLGNDSTAFVSDLRQQPELAAPFVGITGIQSVLATPLRLGGSHGGLVVACSERPAHWTDDQFRIIEWLAAQCAQIVEGMRRQNALAERAREVEAANRAKDQFIAMLSHELRTPLTPVMAAVGALGEDDRLPPDIKGDIEMIHRNISLQSRLIDDLLDLTRITRGRLELVDPKPLNIAAVIKDSAAVVESERNAKQQGLTMDLEKLAGVMVTGDGHRLQQVFWNLLKNAIKFSPPKSQIVISGRLSETGPRQVAINVADNGVGIDAGDLDRIFLPFEQVASEGKRRGSGTGHGLGLGLGLGIAKSIVELHGGSISVSSDGVNRGARFTVQLPVTVQAPAPSSPEVPVQAAVRGAPLRILLVEDHADTSRAMTRLLRRAGHTVEPAENASNAALVFGLSPFDLVISDLGLPDESGLDLMRKLRAAKPGIVGICLSGYGTEADLRDCREAGFSEHLTKPVDMARLHAAIARATSVRGA
jgi:signal transduction histidine kinase/ActR/RegA family two-component response regulator